MGSAAYDSTSKDPMAMPVSPVEPDEFDLARYEAYAAECDQRYADFLQKDEGVIVWQRVRVGEVFREDCRDCKVSLRWQLGALTKSLDFSTDAATYLEPWYGIGTIASIFGVDYTWHPGQAPAVEPIFESVPDVAQLVPQDFDDVAVLRYTKQTVEYFLEQTGGRLPMSWCDIQAPINVAGGLVPIDQFLLGLYDTPDRCKDFLTLLADTIIRYYRQQSELIGDALAQPGHGFASSRKAAGMGLSTDNLVMMSPDMFTDFCSDHLGRIGETFGGVAFHSCGNWFAWLDAVKKIPNLIMVDGAFSPQTDPAHNECEEFRDALAGTGIIIHARMVGDPDEVMSRVKRLWKPGIKLIVGTHVQNPQAQQQLYKDIHAYCS
jgi:uroporphyrinogen-III decarboxylase